MTVLSTKALIRIDKIVNRQSSLNPNVFYTKAFNRKETKRDSVYNLYLYG